MRLRHGVAGDGEALLHQRLVQADGVIDSGQGGHVVDDAAQVGGGVVRGHFPSGDGVDQVALAALGVLGLEDHDGHLPLALDGLLHGGDGGGLVVLNGDDRVGGGEHLHQDLQSADDPAGLLLHEPVVTGDVRLALRAVGDEVVDLLRLLRAELDVGGGGCAAQTDHACGLDLGHDLLVGQLGVVARLSHAGGQVVLSVVVDDDTRGHDPGGGHAGFDGLDLARAGGDDVGGLKSVRFGDDLPCQDSFASFYNGDGGLANVLVQGEHQFSLRLMEHNRHIGAQVFIAL